MDIPPPILAAVISAVTALIISLMADKVRSWLTRPKLEVEYAHDIGGCRVSNTGERVYIRVKIRNTSKHIAKSCRAYLVGVELIGNGKEILYDNPALEWPYKGSNGIDILNPINQFLNVAYSTKELSSRNRTHFKFPTSFTPSQLIEFENHPENCRMRVALVTDNGYRKDFSIGIVWGGSWDKLDARPFDTKGYFRR